MIFYWRAVGYVCITAQVILGVHQNFRSSTASSPLLPPPPPPPATFQNTELKIQQKSCNTCHCCVFQAINIPKFPMLYLTSSLPLSEGRADTACELSEPLNFPFPFNKCCVPFSCILASSSFFLHFHFWASSGESHYFHPWRLSVWTSFFVVRQSFTFYAVIPFLLLLRNSHACISCLWIQSILNKQ
jgi:hypothetical protein